MPPRAAIFLDSNAGAPLSLAAKEALASVIDAGLTNPSSIHSHGRKGKRELSEAREKIALSLGSRTDPEQLIFTSSGSESNQLAIRSVLEPRLARGERPHWITTKVEHDSVLQLVPWLEARGGHVSFLPVDADGAPVVSSLEDLLRPETALVSVVWVNNETGVITDVSAVGSVVNGRRAKGQKVALHVDAAQAWGKLPVDLDRLGAQLVSFSAHKIGGVSGFGVLWLQPGTAASPVILGKQEKGRRGGTENLLGAVATGAAAEALRLECAPKLQALRDRLESEIVARIPGALVNGGGAPRVCNTLNLSFEGVEGDGMVMALDLAGYSVSAGSACASGVLEPSHVLLAMGRTKAQAMAAVRISLPVVLADDADAWPKLEGFVEALDQVVGRMRKARLTAGEDRVEARL